MHLGPKHLKTLLTQVGLEPEYVETRGSADLRDILEGAGPGLAPRIGRAALDRISGLMARIAMPLGRGNTLMVIGRKPDPSGA